MSYSGQARGFRPFAWLGIGALGVGVWAALAGAGVAAADNQSSGASGAAASATPTASAKTTKSARPTTRSARVRAIAAGFITNPQSGPVDLIGGTFLLETGGGGEYAEAGLSPAWKPDLSFDLAPRTRCMNGYCKTDDPPASRATPTASAKATKSPATKSTRPTTRGAGVRAGATTGVVDLIGGAFTELPDVAGLADQDSISGSQPSSGVMNWATTAGADHPKYQVGMVSPRY
ncbi:MAG: hypothetical protein WCI78_19375 [Mycobacterium sp.]